MLRLIAIAGLLLGLLAAGAQAVPSPSSGVASMHGTAVAHSARVAKPTVAVSGNHLVNASGQTVRLLGVNRSGAEYECLGGGSVFDGPVNGKAVKAMVAWHINAVRIPLNEDCWLGINGVSAQTSGKAYEKAIKRYVHTLQAHGLMAILDLHWAAPASHVAREQWPMADADHAPAFWSSVAKAFVNNHGVVFDLFNEPFITSWSCWLSGCATTFESAGAKVSYQTAGMQTLVNAVRATGASQVIMLGGLSYAGDDGEWLAHKPSDPDNQLAVSFHTYNFGGCSESCWNSMIAPLAKTVPVVTGEVGENGCTDSYIDQYTTWADSHGVSYLGWTWNSTGPPSNWDCSAGPALISDYEGTPTAFGVGLREHLAALAH